MVGGVVVIGVDDDEQRAAVGIVVTVAGFSRIHFFRKGIWDVEVILIARRHAVMVADARSGRQAAQRGRRQVACILIFLHLNLSGALVFCRFVNLVARRYEEVDFRMLSQA